MSDDVRILWPFDHNWRSPFRLTYTFNTDVFVSRSGGEQRRALRTTPRKSIETSILVDGSELGRLNRLLAVGQNLPIVVPEFTRKTTSTAAVSAGASAMTFSSIPDWCVEGAEAILIAPSQRKVVTINGAVGLTVAFDQVVNAWPKGTRLCAAVTSNLAPRLRSSNATNALATSTVRFSVEPGSETYVTPPAPTTIDDIEVVTLKPNWASPMETEHSWPVEIVDFDAGLTARFLPIDFPTQLITGTYLQVSSVEAQRLLDVFIRAKGRRGVLFFETHKHDLIAAANLAAGSDVLVVDGAETFNAYATDPVHRAVAVTLLDGTKIYRQVVEYSDQGGVTAITLDQPWPTTIARSSIERVSWLYKGRFASDELTIEWITDEIAQARFTLQSLPFGDPTDYFALRSTPEGDDRETVPGDDRAILIFNGTDA